MFCRGPYPSSFKGGVMRHQASLEAQMVENLPAMQEARAQSLG